jgi:hypothetical protein
VVAGIERVNPLRSRAYSTVAVDQVLGTARVAMRLLRRSAIFIAEHVTAFDGGPLIQRLAT